MELHGWTAKITVDVAQLAGTPSGLRVPLNFTQSSCGTSVDSTRAWGSFAMSDELSRWGLTPRQQREREYYDQYSQTQKGARVNLAPISGNEQRPWNPYWHMFALVKERFRTGSRLLDFGCGWGDNSAVFAHIGYQVEGFDISEGNLDVARQIAEKEGLTNRVRFSVQRAESLDYPDGQFDVVAGVDILHHVEISSALAECRRVLREGGVAFFIEPLCNPLLDAIRNTKLVLRFWPNDASFERHITCDERKLTHKDLKLIGRIFPRHSIDRFRILSRLEVLFHAGLMSLEKLDYRCRFVPFYGCLAGTIVLTLDKRGESL
jgi:ubiquinone/menaquinone biosynthesis C-methylase UbiE